MTNPMNNGLKIGMTHSSNAIYIKSELRKCNTGYLNYLIITKINSSNLLFRKVFKF